MASLTATRINTIADARNFATLVTTKQVNDIEALCAEVMVETYTVTYRRTFWDDEEGEFSERPATQYDIQLFADRIGKSFAVTLRALRIAQAVQNKTRCTMPVLAEFREYCLEVA